MAAAKVPYRVGRESKSDFHEEHAGKIFLKRIEPWPPAYVDPQVISDYKSLNLFHYDRWFEIDRARSTGEGDHLIQAYNMRTVLCSDPENRVIPSTPPAGYDREEMADIWSKKPQYSQLLGPLPNQKWLWNMPELIGPQNPYPDGDWQTREAVTARHRLATESMLYFLQNDASLSEATREEWRKLGYAKDEFRDNGHLPYEVYARETRRMKGREVFTENDARLHGDAKRTPVQRDSISVTEWFMDVHACGSKRYPDTLFEGEIYLNYISHPAQVSYQTMLPEGTDNLLVPVCLSCTHIGWGAIRLEPTWMSLGESAGHAAALAIQRDVSPAHLNTDELVRRLAERRVMISFFNDVSMNSAEPWIAPVQYFGTQGFFGSYDAKPTAPLTEAVAKIWVQAAGEWLHHVPADVSARSLRVLEAERVDSAPVTAAAFLKMLVKVASPASVSSAAHAISLGNTMLPIQRGNACRLLYALAEHRHTSVA